MGNSTTREGTSSESSEFPSTEKFFGFENFGNTCYCNSVLQALYFCTSFRSRVLEYVEKNGLKHPEKSKNENLLISLAELFHEVSTQPKNSGKIAPKAFITRLRKDNEIFSMGAQQDAHEYLNFLTNHISEILSKEKSNNFITELFQGTLSNETRCISCDNVTSRQENFLDLSIDVIGNSSITYCLRQFSSMETIKGEDKFYCDHCNSLQEAQKCLKIQKLPKILILHLKRFKYSEKINAYKKLQDRVTFPFELKLDPNQETSYQLTGVVNHIGSGPSFGHYKSLIRSQGAWISFDDDVVKISSSKQVQSIFGFPFPDYSGTSETGYLLFYQLE